MIVDYRSGLYTVLSALSRPSTPRGSPSPAPSPPASTLANLPAELLHLIGEHLFDPAALTANDRLSGYGVFNPLERDRKVVLQSLLAFGQTCKSVRCAVKPILYRSITLRNIDAVRAAYDSEWIRYVQVLRLHLDSIDEDLADPSWERYVSDMICSLLHAARGLRHLYISATSTEAPLLASVVSRLVPPSSSGLATADRIVHSESIVSFALDCHNEWSSPRFVFKAVEPLLASFTNLDFLMVRSYNDVERNRDRPHVLPLLAHVRTPNLRVLNLGGCWHERDDDLLATLPAQLRGIKRLFLFHGCDHDHGQWKVNAVARLKNFPNLRTVIWEIESCWQAVEMQLSPHNPEHYARQLADALEHISVVGFSRYNQLDHVLGIRRESESERAAAGAGEGQEERQGDNGGAQNHPAHLMPLEYCSAEALSGYVMSPLVTKRRLPVY